MEQLTTAAPDWFTQAINTPYREHTIEVAGCPIHYLQWNDAGKPGLLFVHGGGAHAHWWDFIAPAFLADYSVAAIDLSGMGDSGHREQYSGELFAQELMAVCDNVGFGKDTVIVGHSFGGLATLKAGLLYADRLRGVVICDSAVFPPGFNPGNDLRASPFKAKKMYADKETALTRFKLVPPQPCENQFILDYIAGHSLTQTAEGWCWKFDVRFLQKTIYDNLSEEIKNLKLPAAMIYGEKSMLFGDYMLANARKMYPPSVPFLMLPEARHHLFLDKPLEFITLLKATISNFG